MEKQSVDKKKSKGVDPKVERQIAEATGIDVEALEKVEGDPDQFDLLVLNMKEVVYEDKAKSLILPGKNGNFGILPGHTPFYTKLYPGVVIVGQDSGEKRIEISGGIAKVTQLKVTILMNFDLKEEEGKGN